jgi:hypothetical protein
MKHIKRVINYFNYIWYFIAMAKINMFLSRASVTVQIRKIDYSNPKTWEFCGFSQNGEDGIIDVLISKLKSPTKCSIEIGSNNGIDNCTSRLCVVKRYKSLMIEANRINAKRAMQILNHLQGYHIIENQLVTPENITFLNKYEFMKDHDVFSIDIDSIDYYVAKAFLDLGFKPKIIIAEYNSVFGPDRAITVEYNPNLFWDRQKAGNYHGYYWGCSLAGYKKLFSSYGYQFVTVDSTGVNSIFIDPKEFEDDFIKNLKPGLQFEDNFSTVTNSSKRWKEQFKEVENCNYFEI